MYESLDVFRHQSQLTSSVHENNEPITSSGLYWTFGSHNPFLLRSSQRVSSEYFGDFVNEVKNFGDHSQPLLTVHLSGLSRLICDYHL